MRLLSFARLAALAGLLIVLLCGAAAQDKAQNLEGLYFGAAHIDKFSKAGEGQRDYFSNTALAIDQHASRRFEGLVGFDQQILQQDLSSLAISGVIAASDTCKVLSDDPDARLSLSLNWASFGGGAAGLTGRVIIAVEERVEGSIAFLRPYTDVSSPLLNSLEGTHVAEIVSPRDPAAIMVNVAVGDGSVRTGSLTLPGHTNGVNFACSVSSGGEFAAVGAGNGGVLTMKGQFALDGRGQVVTIEYAFTTSEGKLLGTGIIAILIG